MVGANDAAAGAGVGANLCTLCATGTAGDAIGCGEHLSAMSRSIGEVAEVVGTCLPLDSESACLGSMIVEVHVQYQRISVPHMYSAAMQLILRVGIVLKTASFFAGSFREEVDTLFL